jgi:hypothetical protein
MFRRKSGQRKETRQTATSSRFSDNIKPPLPKPAAKKPSEAAEQSSTFKTMPFDTESLVSQSHYASNLRHRHGGHGSLVPTDATIVSDHSDDIPLSDIDRLDRLLHVPDGDIELQTLRLTSSPLFYSIDDNQPRPSNPDNHTPLPCDIASPPSRLERIRQQFGKFLHPLAAG